MFWRVETIMDEEFPKKQKMGGRSVNSIDTAAIQFFHKKNLENQGIVQFMNLSESLQKDIETSES